MTMTESTLEETRIDSRPIVLLDVDGVINWWGQSHTEPEEMIRHGQVWIPTEVPEVIAEIRERAEIWWCTAWRETANHVISPLLGLGELRVLKDARGAPGADWKSDVVVRMFFDGEFGDRQVIWIEDFIASWRNPGMAAFVTELGENQFRLVDTSEAGYLQRSMLEGWFLEEMEKVDDRQA